MQTYIQSLIEHEKAEKYWIKEIKIHTGNQIQVIATTNSKADITKQDNKYRNQKHKQRNSYYYTITTPLTLTQNTKHMLEILR